MHYLWRTKMYKVYSGKRLLWYCRLQLSFVYKMGSQTSFNLFWSGGKRLLSEFLRKWGWFHRYNERFPRTRQGFVDKRAMITTVLTSSCHWINLVPFCLWKKIPETEFLTLAVNYRKIAQKNKLCHSKQR